MSTAAKVFFIVVVMFAGLMILGVALEPSPEERSASNCTSEGRRAAWISARVFVERALVAPATADFPAFGSSGTMVDHLGGCRFDVAGYVDAENSFGANLRSTFTLEVEYLPAEQGWRAAALVID